MLIFFYKNDGRKLKQIITWLLKSWTATKIRRINYTQTYTIDETTAKIKKTEEKAVIIEYTPENLGKLASMLKKSDIKEFKIVE